MMSRVLIGCAFALFLLTPAAASASDEPARAGRIAFAGFRDERWDILSMQPDGEGLRNVTGSSPSCQTVKSTRQHPNSTPSAW